MNLTIITVNLNNAEGLRKTVLSVISQDYYNFEYIIIDGASTDNSVEVIRQLEKYFRGTLKWISEPDLGIYNAMNKGIQWASGDYVQFLNSGDLLKDSTVVTQLSDALMQKQFPSILYGNMLKKKGEEVLIIDKRSVNQDITFLSFYLGTINHSSTLFRKSLFKKYGLYDESLRIVSDWKWFLTAIVLGKEKPVYVDIDVSLFDMSGISETNKSLCWEEREKVLNELIPQAILVDYKEWAFPIERMKRLRRHPWAYKLVWFIERCLFKWEKWN